MTEELTPAGTERDEQAPQNEAEVRARHESNRAGWNEGALHYTAGLEKSIARLRAGESNLHPVERRNLGDLRAWCKTAVHLQCASGYDTLSLWLEGVQRVIGVDISDVHIENARRMSAALDAPASWYRCDVLDMPRELDGVADLVYTGRGAMCWLQDLNAYAKSVARLLKPGAVYHVFDDHPTNWLFETESGDYRYSGVSYFNFYTSGVGWPSTYIGDSTGIPLEKMARKFEALWSLADIFTALTNAGLRVERMGEHPEEYWDIYPNLKAELRGRIPMTFSMLARKPLEG